MQDWIIWTRGSDPRLCKKIIIWPKFWPLIGSICCSCNYGLWNFGHPYIQKQREHLCHFSHFSKKKKLTSTVAILYLPVAFVSSLRVYPFPPAVRWCGRVFVCDSARRPFCFFPGGSFSVPPLRGWGPAASWRVACRPCSVASAPAGQGCCCCRRWLRAGPATHAASSGPIHSSPLDSGCLEFDRR